jgi:innexin
MPTSSTLKTDSEILYYQWIPFLLLVKAFIFYIPRISWNTFGTRSGIHLSDLVESSFDYKLPNNDAEHRQMRLKFVVDSIDQYCSDHRRENDAREHTNIYRELLSKACCITGKYLGNYLVILYLTTKVMYTSVSLFQIYLLSNMLGSNFALYGLHVLDRLFRGR